jgi:AraC-like DNA-binding protein
MEHQIHPLEEMRDQIMERGLMLFDNVNKVPIYEKPYASPYIVVVLNHQGWLRTIYDLQQKEFQPHDLVVIPPGHIMEAQESSDDYLVSLLVISPRFLEKLTRNYTQSQEQIRFYINSDIHLNDEQYKGVVGYFQMLQAISQVDHPEREALLAKQMKIGVQLIEIYLQENGITTRGFTPAQELLKRFQNAVVKHFHESREVKYYADLLCLSPKYFGTLIKEETGISASEWISRYVIIQAKSLLRHSRNLNIQQISYQLGFSDPAAFTRYFKMNAGLSPKEYRMQQQN